MAKCLDATPRHAESWYRSLFEQTPGGMFVIAADGSIVECNLAFAEALGYASTAEVQALSSANLFFEPAEQASFLGKLHQKAILTNYEWSVRARQGNKVCLLVNARVLEPRSPELLAVGSVVDISERKIEDEETQKHLRLTASLADLGQLALHRSAADHLPQQAVEQLARDLEADYCQILDCSGAGSSLRFVAGAGWNGADVRSLRLDCGQRTPLEVGVLDLPVSCCTQTSGSAHWLTEQGFASAMSVAIGSDEGPCGILSVHSRRVRYFDDQEVSFLQSAANVLAAAMNQLETDQELRTSEERLRLAMDAASLGIWDRDLKTEQITWSKSLAELLGLPPDRTCGLYSEFRALIHPEDVGRVDQTLDRARLEKTPFRHEYRVSRPDGIHWITGRGKFFYDATGQAYRAMGVSMDVSERRRAEEQSRLRDRALEAVSQGIVITDAGLPDNPIIYVNQGFERVTGYSREEAVGRNCRFLQGPSTDQAVVAEIRKAIAGESTSYAELLNYRKDGSTFWNALAISPVANAAGRVTHYLGLIVDVTERRRLEEQYRHAQKMEAVGRFAGGVAHDFNNLLTVINGCGDILLDTIRPEQDAHDLVQQIRQAGERGANLTRQILAFSRHQVVAPRKLDINAVIRNMESMLRRLIGEDLEFQTDLDPDAGPVKADPGQLDQVIVNLVINARDAMPTGGKLTLSTRRLEFTPADLEGRPNAKLGPYVLLVVSDTGAGMDEATLARIFEPFFTTKGTHGTGLGLATVYGIVHQARGFIEVASRPGEGAAFHVYLPCAREPAVAEVLVAEREQVFHSDQTVLLVEDEAGVRKLVRHMLESLGLHVLEASCGPDAIELSHGYADTIHLLVTDVVMPRMSGRELADRLQTSRPEMKVLYMSGYVDDAVVLHGVYHAEAVFLQKPFDAAGLAEKVKESLTRR